MDDTRRQDEDGQEHPPDLPLLTKAGVFVGAALPVLAADIIGHWGVTGLALGSFAAFALAKTSPQIYDQARKHLPYLTPQPSGEICERTIWDRLTNQYPRPKEAREQAQEDRLELHNDLPMEKRFDEQAPELLLLSPAPLMLSQMLTHFVPSLDRLFLAVLPDGTPVFCHAMDLCHVALAGATGGGKSNIMRLLLSQLCKARARVLLLNPHYTRYDIEHQEDWTPFEPYLVSDPMECRRYETIAYYLKLAAEEILPRRLERYAHSQPVGKPYFIAVDELPAIVAEIKEAPAYLAKILREGRKVGMFLITAAQDFLVSTIAPGGGGAVRDCYRTAYYVGGDSTTARILLDVPARLLPESELGKGQVMLRSGQVKHVKQATLVRVPYVDNQALYHLLGPSTYVPATFAPEQDDLQGIFIPGEHAGTKTEAMTAMTGMRSRYHTHDVGAQDVERRKHQRELRLRGVGKGKPIAQPEAAPLPASYQRERQPIPTLQDVLAAFPGRKPSKREIQKHFGITDYQAYKLYQQFYQ